MVLSYRSGSVASSPASVRSAFGASVKRDRAESWGGGLLTLDETARTLHGFEMFASQSAQLIGYTAFGVLIFRDSDRAQIVDTQYATAWNVSVEARTFLVQLTEAEARTALLREPLFAEWRVERGDLPIGSVLIPVPAIPLGGSWDRRQFSAVNLDVYLSMMAQVLSDERQLP